jgi:hypothetical protein
MQLTSILPGILKAMDFSPISTQQSGNFFRKLPPKDSKINGTDLKEVQFGWPLGMPLERKMEKTCGRLAVILRAV